MAVDERARVDWDGRLLVWANAGLETTVLFLLLVAWARPRDGAAALLPLATCLAIPAALALRLLLDRTAEAGPARHAAVLLTALAWSVLAARLSAPPAFWVADAPRPILLLSAALGGPIPPGLQPIAFWTGLLCWWRGHSLADWQPTLDEALGRFRLALGVVGAAVVMTAIGARHDDSARLIAEQATGLALFFVASLLATGLSRRREMAGGSTASTGPPPTARRPLLRATLAPMLMIVLALLVIALAALGAEALTPALLMPAVTLGGELLGVIGSGLAQLSQWLGSLWTAPPPAPAAQPAAATPTPRWEPLSLPRLDPPPWLVPLLGLIFLAATVALTAYFVLLASRAIFEQGENQIRAVSGGDDVEPRPIDARGPVAVFAVLLRLLRSIRAPGSRRRASSRPVAPAAERPPELESIRAAYRELLTWAERQGSPRRPEETPDEFRRRLIGDRPTVGAEATLLTTLYVAARYGGQPCPRSDLERARTAVARLARQESTGTDSS